MAKHVIDADLDIKNNRLLGALLEILMDQTAGLTEGRIGYDEIRKLPVYYNGTELKRLVNETYVQELLSGLVFKDDVDAAADYDIDITTLIDGVSVDGVTLNTGSRVLLFAQSDGTENGVYIIGASPVRSSDMDDPVDFTNAVIPVKYGTNYGGAHYRCKTVRPVIGSTVIEFVDFTPSVPDATEVVKGKIRIATLQEVIAGIIGDAAVTPASLKAVLDPIRDQIGAIAPEPPAGLSGRAIAMSLYTALAESSGDSHDCTDDTTPDGQVSAFYDGDNGELSVEVDGAVAGSHVLSAASDIGSYDSLIITDDSDPFNPGEFGYGMYKQLTALVRPDSVLTVGAHTFQMKHSITGDSLLKEFYVDDHGSVTVANVSVTLPAGTTRYISGVPSLEVGHGIAVDFTVENAVNTHYNDTRIGRVQSLYTQSLNFAPPGFAPAYGDDVVYTGEIVQVLSGVYTEDVSLEILGYNSKDDAGLPHVENTGTRVDTLSIETRKEAGNGLYPASGYGGTFDSQRSLKDFYTEELQLINGKYQWPSGNFTGNVPVAGPDYSTGMGTADRWVLFDTGVTLDSASSFVLTLNGTEGTWSGIETAGVYIQIKVEGQTGWLDANKTFPLVGFPDVDGDACMVYGDSSETVKKVSFGNNPRSGKLWVRIGLPDGSDKKFSQSIGISNIV